MRAKSVPHVEYEVFNALLDSDIIAEVVAQVKTMMVPAEDSVAEKRFDEGVKNAAQYILNLAERRLHRLPEDHPDYQQKK
jgi:hypothetical protein